MIKAKYSGRKNDRQKCFKNCNGTIRNRRKLQSNCFYKFRPAWVEMTMKSDGFVNELNNI